MNYKQGDIVLLPFPYSDLSTAKKRPALVVSNNTFNASSDDFVCCLVTTNPKQDKYTIQITENDVEQGKLSFASTVKPYRIFTTDKKIVVKKLCALQKTKLRLVADKLCKLFVAK